MKNITMYIVQTYNRKDQQTKISFLNKLIKVRDIDVTDQVKKK